MSLSGNDDKNNGWVILETKLAGVLSNFFVSHKQGLQISKVRVKMSQPWPLFNLFLPFRTIKLNCQQDSNSDRPS